MPTAFQRATAVTRPDPDDVRFHADLPASWAAPAVPQGGISLAVTVRAMQAALGRPLPLRSVTCVFAAPVEAGPVEIDVEVLREGRSIAQTTGTTRTPGRTAGLTAVGVFGAERPGFEFTDLEPPDFPDPAGLPSFRDPLPEDVDFDRTPFPIWVHHVEGRPVIGHPPWEAYVPTSSLRAQYQRFDEPPRLADGSIDPLALVALCDTMPGAVAERMGNSGEHPWYGPSADLTVHLTGTARSEWILARGRARAAYDGYASVEIELWDPRAGLVAYGTQTMIFVFDGDPPTGDARLPPDRRSP
jgi:acyl-CoA thioesterase